MDFLKWVDTLEPLSNIQVLHGFYMCLGIGLMSGWILRTIIKDKE